MIEWLCYTQKREIKRKVSMALSQNNWYRKEKRKYWEIGDTTKNLLI